MEKLWEEARLYGRVRLVTLDTGCYYCVIEFSAIDHVKLEATSSFRCQTPSAALIEAIDKAKQVVASLTDATDKLRQIGK